MKPKYTAKIYFENGDILENYGDNIKQLIIWMRSQAQFRFSQISGEIVDNKIHRVIKNIQYDPAEDI